ncbi:hypothetical protein P262_p2100 (plasmid) [Cronobacter malonaticus]|uniref:Uncharacterized protein n=1 Tax=Cronobacter malonaticus TaxID=413503 RepID=V5U5P0_9ENTR|nr:hypothetical protein P262_p2100 [Cronobacter malonaticus]
MIKIYLRLKISAIKLYEAPSLFHGKAFFSAPFFFLGR